MTEQDQPTLGYDGLALMQYQFEPRSWLVENMLSHGLCLLAGRPKLGKSILALQLAVAVAAGRPFLGRPTSAARVLYLALEDSAIRLNERLNAHKRRFPAGRLVFFDYAAFLNSIGALNQKGAAALLKIVTQQQYRLIIIDTLARAMPDRHPSNLLPTYIFSPLQNLLLAKNLTMLLLDHHTKAAKDTADPVTDLLGHTAKAGLADSIWGLYPGQQPDQVRLLIRSRDHAPLDLTLNRSPKRLAWEEHQPNPLEIARSRLSGDLERQIYDLLSTRGPLTARQLCQALDRPWAKRSGLYLALNRLQAKKILDHNRDAYSLTDS